MSDIGAKKPRESRDLGSHCGRIRSRARILVKTRRHRRLHTVLSGLILQLALRGLVLRGFLHEQQHRMICIHQHVRLYREFLYTFGNGEGHIEIGLTALGSITHDFPSQACSSN